MSALVLLYSLIGLLLMNSYLNTHVVHLDYVSEDFIWDTLRRCNQKCGHC